MKIYDTSISCPLRCKKSRGNSTDRFRCYGKLYESQVREVAAAPNQTNERAKKVIKRRWHREQKWGTTLLHRLTSTNGKQPHQSPILPYRTCEPKTNPRIPILSLPTP